MPRVGPDRPRSGSRAGEALVGWIRLMRNSALGLLFPGDAARGTPPCQHWAPAERGRNVWPLPAIKVDLRQPRSSDMSGLRSDRGSFG